MQMTDLKPGIKIEYNGAPHEVISANFSRSSQSKGFMTTRLRNLIAGNVFEVVFRDRDTINGVEMDKRKTQFLYKEGENFVFMDNNTFEQFEIKDSILGEKSGFLKDGMDVEIMIYKDAPISVELPAKVTLKIIQTEPGIKSATASDVRKPAIVETGYKLTVPAFINEGDMIRINTSTGEYVERA
ncbi:MAG TPA: elongation factor P [Patescibacteria group bacterium]|nr:elongation factor P [Patescibacteria group bacterium]